MVRWASGSARGRAGISPICASRGGANTPCLRDILTGARILASFISFPTPQTLAVRPVDEGSCAPMKVSISGKRMASLSAAMGRPQRQESAAGILINPERCGPIRRLRTASLPGPAPPSRLNCEFKCARDGGLHSLTWRREGSSPRPSRTQEIFFSRTAPSRGGRCCSLAYHRLFGMGLADTAGCCRGTNFW